MKINWINYFFHIDFSGHADVLSQFPAGDDMGVEQRLTLASVLQEVDRGAGKELWLAEGAAVEWNLELATVTYNGVNLPTFATNSKYSHVMVLSFDKTSLAPAGKVYLQYNCEAS